MIAFLLLLCLPPGPEVAPLDLLALPENMEQRECEKSGKDIENQGDAELETGAQQRGNDNVEQAEDCQVTIDSQRLFLVEHDHLYKGQQAGNCQ